MQLVRRLSSRRWWMAVPAGMAALLLSVAGATAHTGHRKAGHDRAGHTRGFTSRVFAQPTGVTVPTPTGSQPVSQPDDITHLNNLIYVAFQNGVGPQGQADPTTGNTDSTVLAFNRRGRVVKQWNITGKCDGLTADPKRNKVIATVNEDADSSLYLLAPRGGATHYAYNESLPHNGGTDAISIYRGRILISASAPGTTGTQSAPQASFPAVYLVKLVGSTHTADVSPLFSDESSATVANTNASNHGQSVTLGLTDPDSNEVVPGYAPRFRGDFMLTSQGDEEQIFVARAGTARQKLSVLQLSDSVDDTAWPSDKGGTLYSTDNTDNAIYAITGPFHRGQVFASDTPCDADNPPASCSGSTPPPNFLGRIDPWTGQITPVALNGPAPQSQGLLFLPR